MVETNAGLVDAPNLTAQPAAGDPDRGVVRHRPQAGACGADAPLGAEEFARPQDLVCSDACGSGRMAGPCRSRLRAAAGADPRRDARALRRCPSARAEHGADGRGRGLADWPFTRAEQPAAGDCAAGPSAPGVAGGAACGAGLDLHRRSGRHRRRSAGTRSSWRGGSSGDGSCPVTALRLSFRSPGPREVALSINAAGVAARAAGLIGAALLSVAHIERRARSTVS